MAYCWTFEKDLLKLENFVSDSQINMKNCSVTMDLQKKYFIEAAESCPHGLKIRLWKKLGRLVQKYRVAI